MQCQNEDLWGSVSTTLPTGLGTEIIGFEDSFSPQEATATGGERQQYSTDGDYIPLEDSSQYLAGLERKLARVQGRTSAGRQTESRRLIDALASSRNDHTHQLMHTLNNFGINDDDILSDSDNSATHMTGAVDPQGALGAMLRKVAPDKIALTPEELCHLLEADILSKTHEASEDQAEKPLLPKEHSKTMVEKLTNVPHLPLEHSKSTVEELDCGNSRTKDACTENSISRSEIKDSCLEVENPLDQKEQSSDEGEK